MTLMALILGGFAWIIAKLDKIGDAIADMRENRVSHAVCEKRRESCPCLKELDELKGEVTLTTHHVKLPKN